MDIKKNKLCLNDVNENENLFILYRIISNLYLCHHDFVKADKINFKLFLEYFEK